MLIFYNREDGGLIEISHFCSWKGVGDVLVIVHLKLRNILILEINAEKLNSNFSIVLLRKIIDIIKTLLKAIKNCKLFIMLRLNDLTPSFSLKKKKKAKRSHSINLKRGFYEYFFSLVVHPLEA